MKLSIIIPAYKTAQYLPQCLESVLFQDIQDLEAICINDGSPDNVLEIMRSYAARDPRVVVIDKENEGVGAARNDGLRVAKGEFVAFMDSDDFYPNPHVLSHLYDAATRNHLDCAGGHYVGLKPDGATEETRFAFHGLDLNVQGVTEYQDFQFDYGYTCYIYRNSVLQENRILFPYHSRFQDPPFFVRAMYACKHFYALDEPTYCYRLLPGAAKTTVVKTLAMLDGLMDNLRFSRENGLSRLHFITATRLDEEGSYMALQNLQDPRCREMLAKYLQALALVDVSWLKEQGQPLADPFLPKLFQYAFDTAAKYERLRQNKFVRILSKLLGR